MKLALVSVQGVEVLTGAGQISPKDLQILRAGITNLLKSGKNRIVLELPEASAIPTEILYELTKFDVMARELSGRVVLAGVSASLKDQIHRFATPPVIECFDAKEGALAYFKKPQAVDDTIREPVVPAKAPAAPSAVPGAAPAQGAAPGTSAEDQAKVYKEDIRQQELAGLHELRKKISDLENENQLLQEKLLKALEGRRSYPPTDATHRSQVEALEQRVAELLEQVKAATKQA